MSPLRKRIKLKGRLKRYMQTSLYLGVLLAIVNLMVYLLNVPSGLVVTCFLLLYFAVVLSLQLYNNPVIMNELISFATQYGQVQKVLLRELEIPYAMLDETGCIIWTNEAFERVVHKEKGYKKSITSLFPSVTREKLPGEQDMAEMDLTFHDCSYVVKMRKISLSEMVKSLSLIHI